MHEGRFADLRGHHLTQQQRPEYASGNRAVVARKASRVLLKERHTWIASEVRQTSAKPKFIPLPGCTEGKQETTVRGPRKFENHGRSSLRNELDINNYTEVGDFGERHCDVEGGDNKLCGSTNINISDSDQTLGSELEVADSSRKEPDDYEIEMAKVEEEGFFEKQAEQAFQIPGLPIFNSGNTEDPERQTKRKRESVIPPDSSTFDLPGDLDHDEKRRPRAGQWKFSPVGREGREKQTKRKRESTVSPDSLTLDLPGDLDHDEKRMPSAGQWKFSPVGKEGRDGQTKRKREPGRSAETPVFDLQGDVDHDEKRRKLKTGTNSSQAPPAGPQDKGSEENHVELGPCDFFCQGTAVADVLEAMKAVGAYEKPQQDSDDKLKLIIAEALYPIKGQDDVRVARAAANLEIDQANSNVPGLDSADRDALKDAFGTPDRLPPSVHEEEELLSVATIPRAVRFFERYSVNKSLLVRHGHLNKFRNESKPTRPSRRFRSFFANRRQREVLLHKGSESWDKKDASFIRSGKEIAEPSARLGAEFVAKSLLDVSDATSLSPNGTIS